jgi:hypothetical protein
MTSRASLRLVRRSEVALGRARPRISYSPSHHGYPHCRRLSPARAQLLRRGRRRSATRRVLDNSARSVASRSRIDLRSNEGSDISTLLKNSDSQLIRHLLSQTPDSTASKISGLFEVTSQVTPQFRLRLLNVCLSSAGLTVLTLAGSKPSRRTRAKLFKKEGIEAEWRFLGGAGGSGVFQS